MRIGLPAAVVVLAMTLLTPLSRAEEVPLWEGLTKTPRMTDLDAGFVAAIREVTGGDMAAGYLLIVRQGFEYINAGDAETAIKRFNQATLIDPESGWAYWGFALATYMRGDGLAVAERWFQEAETRMPGEPAILADHGRILDESGEPERAKAYFLRVIALAPTMPEGHIGMASVLRQLGDPIAARQSADEAKRLLGQ